MFSRRSSAVSPLFVLFALASSSSAPAEAPAEGRSPNFESRYATTKYSLWVDAADAITPAGDFRYERFDPSAMPHLRSSVRKVPTGNAVATPKSHDCEGGSTLVFEDRPIVVENGDLNSLAKNAKTVASGEVKDIRPGFLMGRAGSLLRISNVRDIAGTSKRGGSLWAFYPNVKFAANGLEICRSDPRFPYQPSVGDEVVVFVLGETVDKGRSLVAPEGTEIMFQDPSGALHATARVEGLSRLSAIEDRVLTLRASLPASER